MQMKFERSSGILLHPTSLPGPYGIGELGPGALGFIRFLSESHQRIWQMLPLTPTGSGNSPYQSYSAFAGNPLLISTDRLIQEGCLSPDVLKRLPGFPKDSAQYESVNAFKINNLREAHKQFKPTSEFYKFCADNSWWLEDYVLYAALKERYHGEKWTNWDPELASRQPEALATARQEYSEEADFYRFTQYLFFKHYGDVKREANLRGIRITGDLPIFVAHDSADVWAHPELFYLNEDGEPTVVAGVPPDYFSETGQLWGNPLYRWEKMEETAYKWWVKRLRMALTLFDAVRIDHFRGFEAYWEVQAGEKTAVNGRWVKGPGEKLFETLLTHLGELPIIAEDLGTITPEVEALRDRFGLPGMKVLQFAFSGPENPYLPHNYSNSNCAVYTGTHDNDTTNSWWASASEEERDFARRYMGCEGEKVSSWDFIRLAFSSVAVMAVVPMQDVVELGAEARMNIPGKAADNWRWRLDPDTLTSALVENLRELTEIYGR